MSTKPKTMGQIVSDEAGRINPSIKKRWIAALNSGEYEQLVGQPFLCRINKNGVKRWNALGVLCDVMGIEYEDVTYNEQFILRKYGGADSYLTPRVAARAGIGPKRGAFVARIYIDQTIFSQGYDIKNLSSSGTPFGKLASLIEDQL